MQSQPVLQVLKTLLPKALQFDITLIQNRIQLGIGPVDRVG